MYLYHAKDGNTCRWFITRGFPFVGDLYKIEPTTAYQPLTTMVSPTTKMLFGGQSQTTVLGVEVLEDKGKFKVRITSGAFIRTSWN